MKLRKVLIMETVKTSPSCYNIESFREAWVTEGQALFILNKHISDITVTDETKEFYQVKAETTIITERPQP